MHLKCGDYCSSNVSVLGDSLSRTELYSEDGFIPFITRTILWEEGTHPHFTEKAVQCA